MPPRESESAGASTYGELRPAPESLLGFDVGAAFTKAALFEPVEGQYRLIARGQARTDPDAHLYDSLARACQPIEALTGRQLMVGGEPLGGEPAGARGVEVLAASLSCWPSLRVLATSREAAIGARSERCAVDIAPAGSLAERLAWLSGKQWDAVAGSVDEVEDMLRCLGMSSEDPDTPVTAAITGDEETIRRKVSALSLQLAMARVPGLPELASAATEELTTAAGALLELTKLIASRFGLRLAIVDCGATQSTLSCASPEGGTVRVCPHDRPLTDIPANPEDLSALHQALQGSLAGCADVDLSADLLVATGALGRVARWSEPALTLLNGIQPSGVIQFAVDSGGILSQLAVFATSYPDVVCSIFEQDSLLGLGAAICLRGSANPGTRALEIRWRTTAEDEQIRDVNYGELVRLPLPAGRKASLALYPAKHIDVGLKRPGTAATAHVDGGRVGLMVDAREPAAKAQRDPWQQALE